MSDAWILLEIANEEIVNLKDEIAERDRDYEKLQAENTHLRSKLAEAKKDVDRKVGYMTILIDAAMSEEHPSEGGEGEGDG
jgi:regulator of replication initiation timing